MPDPSELQYPDPIHGGNEKVSRQVGLNPEDTQAIEDEKFAREHPVIQGSADIFTTRQVGLGQRFSSDGTLMADHDAQPGTPIVRSDRPIAPTADASFPGRPGVVPGLPPAPSPAPVVDITRSDDGGSDPRDASGGPQVFTAAKLPVVKKAPVVPVVISASGVVVDEVAKAVKAAPKVRTVRVRAKAAPIKKG